MKTLLTTIALSATLALPAAAQDMSAQLKARQGQFRIMALNLGVLGDMVKGATEYDATAAQAAAESLVGISMVHQPTLFAEGSDEMSVDGTRALPAIWEDMAGVMEDSQALIAAATTMEEAAGTDLAALQGAMAGLGQACGACHQAYRKSNN